MPGCGRHVVRPGFPRQHHRVTDLAAQADRKIVGVGTPARRRTRSGLVVFRMLAERHARSRVRRQRPASVLAEPPAEGAQQGSSVHRSTTSSASSSPVIAQWPACWSIRLHADGTLDLGFGTGGVLRRACRLVRLRLMLPRDRRRHGQAATGCMLNAGEPLACVLAGDGRWRDRRDLWRRRRRQSRSRTGTADVRQRVAAAAAMAPWCSAAYGDTADPHPSLWRLLRPAARRTATFAGAPVAVRARRRHRAGRSRPACEDPRGRPRARRRIARRRSPDVQPGGATRRHATAMPGIALVEADAALRLRYPHDPRPEGPRPADARSRRAGAAPGRCSPRSRSSRGCSPTASRGPGRFTRSRTHAGRAERGAARPSATAIVRRIGGQPRCAVSVAYAAVPWSSDPFRRPQAERFHGDDQWTPAPGPTATFPDGRQVVVPINVEHAPAGVGLKRSN